MNDEERFISSGDMETFYLRRPAELGCEIGDDRIASLDSEPGAFISGMDLRKNQEARAREMEIAALKLLRSRQK